jgi:hypothetical protein
VVSKTEAMDSKLRIMTILQGRNAVDALGSKSRAEFGEFVAIMFSK